MGQIKKITCKYCTTSWEVAVGAGRAHCRVENILHFFRDDDQKKILETLGENKKKGFNFQFIPGYCEDCKKIVSKPTIKICETGEEYTGICNSCGTKLGTACGNPECPECKKIGWQETLEGFWD